MYNLLHFNLKDPTKETQCANVYHIGQFMVRAECLGGGAKAT